MRSSVTETPRPMTAETQPVATEIWVYLAGICVLPLLAVGIVMLSGVSLGSLLLFGGLVALLGYCCNAVVAEIVRPRYLPPLMQPGAQVHFRHPRYKQTLIASMAVTQVTMDFEGVHMVLEDLGSRVARHSL